MNAFLIIALFMFLGVLAQDRDQEWIDFKKEFNKSYSPGGEDDFFKQIFLRSAKAVDYYNKLYEEKKITFKTKLNKYADMDSTTFSFLGGVRITEEEWKKFLAEIDNSVFTKLRGTKAPPYINWAEKNALLPAVDQGTCASCYAFATNAAVEAHHYITNKVNVKLSEQQLVDCTRSLGNQGCNGGYMTNSYEFYKDNGGAMLSSDYPYNAEENKCSYDKSKAGVQVKSYVNIEPENEERLKEVVGLIGPVTVGMHASLTSFQFYSSGIFDDTNCKKGAMDVTHAVVIVGYGTSNGIDYWIIRNSMGPSWGMNGYGLIRRGTNACGITNLASYPVIAKARKTRKSRS